MHFPHSSVLIYLLLLEAFAAGGDGVDAAGDDGGGSCKMAELGSMLEDSNP